LDNEREREGVYLDVNDRNDAFGLVEMPGHPVHGLRDKVQHQVEIHLILLYRGGGEEQTIIIRQMTAPVITRYVLKLFMRFENPNFVVGRMTRMKRKQTAQVLSILISTLRCATNNGWQPTFSPLE
jgi:hypothetical protein